MNDDLHFSGVAEWQYIGIDPNPPLGKKINLLTKGNIQVTGNYVDDGSFIAWAPLIKRNKQKEAAQKALSVLKASAAESSSKDSETAVLGQHAFLTSNLGITLPCSTNDQNTYAVYESGAKPVCSGLYFIL